MKSKEYMDGYKSALRAAKKVHNLRRRQMENLPWSNFNHAAEHGAAQCVLEIENRLEKLVVKNRRKKDH